MSFSEKFLEGISDRWVELIILLIHTYEYELGNRLHGYTNPISQVRGDWGCGVVVGS